ncbi:tetratricopeptide repeat protein [uncultured Bifidobacterium sp.]|uniref:tetratricopeptide repeat protein n=1 Tax=uncultured Bifidobacterium sp. TaxID=165187 RepID=UPI00259A50AF|nr:tetratricopeptide repeat protein [uncultured Bifidobacterium sp.]
MTEERTSGVSHGNAFEAAVRAPEDMLGELTRHAIRLTPLVKRRLFDGFDGVPETLRLGWAQLPSSGPRSFSLGVFVDRGRFCQIALADAQGRVFVGDDPTMDTHGMETRFMFSREEEVPLPAASGRSRGRGRAIRGGVVGRDANGRMMWLASWLKSGNRYTLEQMRANLPDAMRRDLEYRDAIAIAFFAAYMLPQMQGLLLGFGSGNIFRRLNREAPMGAIRRSLRDTMEARAHGLRASGLEDHFADLMREAGALDQTPGLEAVHGAEPLHLYTSTYSGCYFFAWDANMTFAPVLKSLRIEGNLNRFAAVSAWLERNARLGLQPTEDTVTRAQAAQIDMALLDDPALIALYNAEGDDIAVDPLHDDGVTAVVRMVDAARRLAADIRERHPDPAQTAHELGQVVDPADADGSEWVYRQTMSLLLRRLRLPYRFDAEIRSNLKDGNVAIAFTTAGASMMPESRYDADRHGWVALDGHQRAAMSAAYNLRVGLLIAALSFGADSRVRQVSLHIDSIGLEEAVAEQDSAISELMSQALHMFERIRTSEVGLGGAKGDPKDGDMHGDPARRYIPQTDEPTEPSEPADGPERGPASDGDEAQRLDESSIDAQFEDLMRDVDIDEMMFAPPEDVQDAGGVSESTDIADGGDDPLEALRRNPTVRNLVTVTFGREEFLTLLRRDGLNHPLETYRRFDAVLDVDADGGLQPVDAQFDLRDSRFSPVGSQEEPELAEVEFSKPVGRILGARDVTGLSIQRADLLQRGVAEFHRLAADTSMPTVAKAQQAMALIERIGDPELTELAPQVTSALIDGTDTPDFEFRVSSDLDAERLKSRDLLFSGRAEQAIQTAEAALGQVESLFAAVDGVPRYFNSYAERVVYNRLFATPGERTVLIPDNVFYTHMELADILSQLKGVEAALPHLNAMVGYAPAYPLAHMKLAVQLARNEDWDSARAACLNALRVALDRDDAAFAYYRFAYAEWMRDQFDVAAAAYVMSEHIAPGKIGALEAELGELVARAHSQCIPVPESVEAAAKVLADHDLPVWPHTEVASIVRKAARVCVDQGMFVPARTLSVAAARMNDSGNDGIDVVQAQFLRSLSS